MTKNRTIVTMLVATLFMLSLLWASADAPPKTMSYQGFLTDSAGIPINSTTMTINVKIYTVSAGGTAIYDEDHNPVTVNNGQFEIVLGSDASPTTGVWDSLDFSQALYLEITADSETLSPRIPLSTVAYARFAHSVATGAITATHLSGIPNSGTNGQLVTLDGTGSFTWTTAAGIAVTNTNMALVGTTLHLTDSTNSELTADLSSLSGGGSGWSLTGNTGTTLGTNFIGTTDAQDFMVKVEGNQALLIETNGISAPNIIGGYSGNTVTSGVLGATIGGGGASANVNSVTDNYGTVGGGEGNTASGSKATVGGGRLNTASGYAATVGGGPNNTASGYAATVGGGFLNTASGSRATVGGGVWNKASGYAATVGGGVWNTASGQYSYAAGRKAKANEDGAFVWADSTDADFNSGGTNTFNVRATGGYFLYTNSGLTAGVTMASGAGSWSSVSDRNKKANFSLIDGQDVLQKVVDMPISTWNYKSQDESIRHMGVMAQDFHSAFGLGTNDTTISTVDADGVALAAIQGLNEKLETENAELRQELEAVTNRLDKLEASLNGQPTSAGFDWSSLLGLSGLVLVGFGLVWFKR